MLKALARHFDLEAHGTTVRREAVAGLTNLAALSMLFYIFYPYH